MDSFGFDFPGGDLLDLGSLGSWSNTTPMGNSPNGGSGGLPFSVGTPTGVQSLGDDPFANMPGSGADDFGFGVSPKPSPGAATSAPAATPATTSAGPATRKPTDGAAPTTSAADSGSSANSYFGSELESGKIKTDPSSSSDPKKQAEADVKKNNSSATTTTSSAAPSSSVSTSAPTSSSSALKTEAATVSSGAGPTAATSAPTSMTASKPEPAQTSSTMAAPGSSGAMTSTAPGSAASTAPSASTTSAARPHIGNQQQHNQQQMQHAQQQRYSGQMMVNQQPNGQPGFAGQPYQQMHMQQQMAGVSGAQPTSAAGQYMNAQAQAYRPPTTSYEEEFTRVRAMMMQHPDLIPPPTEVLLISRSQSAASQQQGMGMGGNAAYMQRAGQQAMARGGAGNAAYAQYGAMNPNMMPQQNAQQAGMMNAARLRAAQMQQQQQRGGASRTPGGNPADAQTAWQSENDLPLRRKMIGKIVSLLQQRKPDAPAEWIRRLPDMARRLEDSLYRTAKNRDEYGDFSSLKTRLQHLAVTMGARAQHKAGGNPRGGAGAGGAGVIPNAASGAAGNAGMMGGAGNVPPGMAMNPATGAMGPQGHVVNNMQYGNRMTQQQLMQQQHLQMQMQNPQMRQQFTPQQLQQYQEAQLQRRQFQMQQAQQQAQMQRQNSLQQQQQYQQNQALQRQNSMRQQQMQQAQQQGQQPGGSAAMQQQMQQQMNQRQNPNFMQQQQAQAQAQAQAQRRNAVNGTSNAAGAGGQPRMSSEMNLGESSDFLNLDLSQLGSDDLPGDGTSGLNGGPDAMKSGGNDGNVTGAKRTLSQSQQQMAAAANAAAFKRTKMGGTAPGNQNNTNAAQRPGNVPTGVSQGAQQPGMQKPVTSTSGSSKTPPMSTVNAK